VNRDRQFRIEQDKKHRKLSPGRSKKANHRRQEIADRESREQLAIVVAILKAA
jgi:hypothetical protein